MHSKSSLVYCLRDFKDYSRQLDHVADVLAEQLEEVLDNSSYDTESIDDGVIGTSFEPNSVISIPLVFGFAKRNWYRDEDHIDGLLLDKLVNLVLRKKHAFHNYSYVRVRSIYEWVDWEDHWGRNYLYSVIQFGFEEDYGGKYCEKEIMLSDYISVIE